MQKSNDLSHTVSVLFSCMLLISHNQIISSWPKNCPILQFWYQSGSSCISCRHQPRLPVDLLFPTIRRDENSWTIDKYVTSLYDKLKFVLASARDTAILEAQRQKWYYNHKAGAVELHLGDKVLVKLDAFRGQQQKLKNWWADALYTVVKHVVDGIPVYEVQNNANKKRQVLHWAWLLLWLAKPDGEPLRMNRILIESGLTGAELVTECQTGRGTVQADLWTQHSHVWV